MISFPGNTPFTPLAQPYAAGQWPNVRVLEDGDARDAGTMSLAAKNLVDRTNYLAWHSIDPINGGTYTSTSPVVLANPWRTSGRVEHVGANAWTALRAPIYINGDGPGIHYTMTDADTWIVSKPTAGATVNYYWDPPSSNVPALYRFYVRLVATTDVGWTTNGEVVFYATSGTLTYRGKFVSGHGVSPVTADYVLFEYTGGDNKLIVLDHSAGYSIA